MSRSLVLNCIHMGYILWKLRTDIHLRPYADFYEIHINQKMFVSTFSAEPYTGRMKYL